MSPIDDSGKPVTLRIHGSVWKYDTSLHNLLAKHHFLYQNCHNLGCVQISFSDTAKHIRMLVIIYIYINKEIHIQTNNKINK